MSLLNGKSAANHLIFNDDCLKTLSSLKSEIDLTFLDPPFNQQKEYAACDDNLPESHYWEWMQKVCSEVFRITTDGGAVYFMQREKNTGQVLRALSETGWTFQNLIVWKKMTSAVPSPVRFGKSFQTIVYATKGNRPRAFNRLRIEPALLKHQKHERENGCFVTDVWDDIRELTSGYFAGDEALKNADNTRFHKQQAPVALLLRIILSSTRPGDFVLDPFAGTGTTAVVAKQLNRSSVSVEIDRANFECMKERLSEMREADRIEKFYKGYICTENLSEIWGANHTDQSKSVTEKKPQLLFAANI